MNLSDFIGLISFSSSRGVDILTAPDPVKQAMLDLYNLLNPATPVVASKVPTTQVVKPAKKAKKNAQKKSVQNTGPTKLVDGIYEFRARRAFNHLNANIFKVAIIDIVMPPKREKYPFTAELDSSVRLVIEKLWNSNPELFSVRDLHKGRGHQDTKVNVGKAHFTFNNTGSIEKITDVVWYPVAMKAQPTALATQLAPPPSTNGTPISTLEGFTVIISKNDPQLLADKMMTMWQYNPKSLALMNDENIVGRLGEIAMHRQYGSFEWFNKDIEQIGPTDFKIPDRNLTLDIKTIKTIKNNLLIKKKKVDTLSLADIFCLALVEDVGDSFRVSFLGYISKEATLKHIINYPPCYMAALDGYKVDKRYLSIILDLTTIFHTV